MDYDNKRMQTKLLIAKLSYEYRYDIPEITVICIRGNGNERM